MVLSFIDNNYKNPIFSMDLVSDSLNIQKSRVRAVIKDSYGYSFAQHVALLRMNEFKRLLLETDESIQNIIKDVGYMDTANFLRKFREAEGMTPGKYRSLNKNIHLIGNE